MIDTQDEGIRGLRAAAKVAGCSPSGLQKMVDNGDVPAKKVDGVYIFEPGDLEALGAGLPRTEGDESSAETPEQEAFAGSGPLDGLAAPGQSDATKPQEAIGSNDGEVAATVFADLVAGKDLRTIVVERKLAPGVVHRWHEEWQRLGQIDELRRPVTERRIFRIEQRLDSQKQAGDIIHGEIVDVRDRVNAIEAALGITYIDEQLCDDC